MCGRWLDQPMSGETTILVVDDDATNRKIIEKFLMSDGSYQVVQAENGIAALEQAVSAQPDLVLCDVMMEDLNGFEVVRRMRALPQTRDVPVIMVTALSDQKYLEKGREVGANDYLTKPLRRVELLERVAAILAEQRARQPTSSAGDSGGGHLRVRIVNVISALQGLEAFETDTVDGELLGTAIGELEQMMQSLE